MGNDDVTRKIGDAQFSDARWKFGMTRRTKSQNRKWPKTGVFYLLLDHTVSQSEVVLHSNLQNVGEKG